jgi:hypothetical protein
MNELRQGPTPAERDELRLLYREMRAEFGVDDLE